MQRRVSIAVAAVTVMGLAASTAQAASSPATTAADKAADYVNSRPTKLHASSSDAFHQHGVISTPDGLQYVPFDRSYKGLPVVGGDFVVVTKPNGDVASTSVAQDEAINVSTTPSVSADQAAQTARAKLAGTVDFVGTPALVVDAEANTPTLAYETVVTGHRGAIPSRLHVITDATSGAVLSSQDEVSDGTGTGWINGPTPFSINTSGSGTSFSMTDSTRPGISCRNFTGQAVLTGTDDVWGNGNGTSIETGCADAMFDVQHEWDMLKNWFGRSGINGTGSGFPMYVGLNDENAYWDGTGVSIGHNTAGQWIASLDVVGHEFGHAIDSTTPGGQSSNGVSEGTGDIFGALTEAYANEPSAYDAPDYSVGEKVNLVGSGPIRYMYNPSTVGDPNCYSSSIPSMETHAAAGPLNHWFYLVAEGTNPTDGQPVSPTCNSTTVPGIGIQNAGKVFYNAMLSKTSGMTYLKYRTATLTATKNLFPSSCTQFNTVKAAWDAVSVPAQPLDPTCTVATSPTVTNPGNQTGSVSGPVSLQMTASGFSGTVTWSATGMPAGVTINASTGLISGTPTTQATYATVVKAVSGTQSNTASFTWTINAKTACVASQKLANPGFESGVASWTASAGVIGAYNSSGEPAHTGTYSAWMDGYGTTHSDTLSQSVAIPAGCTSYTLSFWLHIDSAETTTTTQFDKLTVALGSTTLATYSNLNKATGYVQRTFNIANAAGTTQLLKFTATEDSSLQTSFVIDDTAVSVS